MTRAAIYLRISRDLTGEGLGVERQREAAEQYAAAGGYEVAETFTDNDISAAGGKKRPGFEALLDALNSDHVSVVIAWNWDRLTRNRPDTVRLIETCQRANAKVALIRGSDLDMSTPSGRMTAGILAEVAQNEIETKGERQSLAQRQRAAMGRPPKGVRPLGYTVAGEVIEHEAEAVRNIYAAFHTGASLRALATALSGVEREDLPHVPRMQKHTRTLAIERNTKRVVEGFEEKPVPDDGPWSPSTVLGILRNPRYAGYSTYTPKEALSNGDRRRSWRAQILRGDGGEPVAGQWEAIVNPQVWENVQDRLDDQGRITNRSGTERKHLGSGLFRCGVCDKPVKAHSQRYRCAGHVMRSREQIEKFVVEVVRRRLALPDLQDLLPRADEPRLREIKKEIDAHRARIARAERDYDSDDEDVRISARVLNRITDEREAKIRALEEERAKLSSSQAVSGVIDSTDPVQAFDDGDLATRRSTIDALCVVRLHPHPRGRKTFDPDTVSVEWR
ncbi:recombinase family protein [Luteipulveratus sp. YIM 133132]|uniref:recombinase family protein n=1 Tax=Luteipulveratus flavus TaxID=3031728 RepID=UPI0023AEBFE0|nr:recombinase family protein [Luteipulveratus sp. YIM 133132]MDE9364124.1 recombinase family protein [Luteipulveratus sp. YIM 133132]